MIDDYAPTMANLRPGVTMANSQPGMLTDVPGVTVGHWTSDDGDTGCTVVLFPEGTVASGEIRGGAPATREFALLEPERMIQRIDAVALSGGSAFGLATADGVMAHLAKEERGFPTVGGVVPIVVGMCIYDLTAGTSGIRPNAASGRAAALAASDGPVPSGRVGAGAGATYRKWWGKDGVRPGGIGMATVHDGDTIVSALVVVNALGDIDPGDGSHRYMPPARAVVDSNESEFGANTTIGVIVTNARIDKLGCQSMAQAGHDGYARALVPAHTAADGDALVAASTGQVDTDPAQLRIMATEAVTRSIRSLL